MGQRLPQSERPAHLFRSKRTAKTQQRKSGYDTKGQEARTGAKKERKRTEGRARKGEYPKKIPAHLYATTRMKYEKIQKYETRKEKWALMFKIL